MRLLSHHFSSKDLLSMIVCSSTWLSKAEPLPTWYNFKCHYHPQHAEQDRKRRQSDEEQKQNKKEGPSIGSPARIQKLIASQSDPLLAKEIFDLASREPDFCHSYATFHTLILKLGRSHQFSLMQSILSSLRSQQYSVSPSLFSHIIQIYGDAGLPDKALKTFYTILEFNMKPLPKHLNLILEILVTHRNFLRPAFDLFRSAHKYGVLANTESYNILMRAFCLNDDLSIAYSLFNQMFKRDISPNVESYRILMQGLCRKSQVNTAVDLLEDMLNKGFVPDALSYSTLLNSLCRKKKFKEAYKLLCRMKVKGCNPDIVHYNTVILGFCREGRAVDACKILEDMPSNGCLPNLVSYRTLVGGLSDQGMYDEAKNYMAEMMSKGFSPHFSVVHVVVKGFCNLGKIEEACGVVGNILSHDEGLHADTWEEIVSRILEWDDAEKVGNILEEIVRAEIKPDTRIVEVGPRLGEYLMNRRKSKSRKGMIS
ncbi:pentatricopeptide repeat-containing protein At4g01400, mitochondrial [Lycium barbarum]|uniref:pentatricopeptide repeat-containing protein At4g01400, mitochondrial n=1 Tax=Lycium barbarum TaxID=112863 RepID=UPI00293E84F2|nr:pentatricopeptide repeat-containing protein At4g01400, mitochondrial [Lycium barbarum]XP_060169848.1 pentatricopeptide repeat-containing protein At4g01400, mitochondrial [Lycium barbarum]XP_060169849.1 pentatricopeptide repeat-containing protein At4g01400, mitochondrial [Lycium barbarum]XP_060169850.1 pentatricopeptide repeat-containing protein At4g01400, mitochondrial [Lycium barbarum]XP_060169851.1 pentatricopeptide repeat-containing protein At4g01400, mitochondrial [Lycium barbarum]XP_06